MDKLSEMGYMLDFYGGLLTEKQKQIMSYHYEEDMSLSEISEIHNISRQAVHDIIKRTEKILFDYENELGLVKIYLKEQDTLKLVKDLLHEYNEMNIKKAIEYIDELIDV
jgi:predicted DNA-binding protein YlxM (UPF0122 family)